MLRSLLVGAAISVISGCHAGPGAPAKMEQKEYHLRGKIVSVDSAGGAVTVQHGPIPGLMDAMMMSYKLVQPNITDELHAGDTITARVLVDQSPEGPINARLDQIVVVAQSRPDTLPKVQYHVPKPGEPVPDFHLLNQNGKKIDLAQFKGRVLLLTFIYTRCPLADFCPRMSSNFAQIDKDLAKDRRIYSKTHLLSISFDPAYDTPTVLRSYGGAHTGRFTEEDFAHWDFAAPSMDDLAKVEQWFDLGVTGDSKDPSSIMHSLSTVLIGKDGKVIHWYPTNDWNVDEVAAQVKQATSS
jgi:protein SCO1